MPVNAITLYCGRKMTDELEQEIKQRISMLADALTGGRNRLGVGQYGKHMGRPPGVSQGMALLYLLRMQPDAMLYLCTQGPTSRLTSMLEFMIKESPQMRAAILAAVANSGESPDMAAFRQEVDNVVEETIQAVSEADRVYELTPEQEAEIRARYSDQALAQRLKDVKLGQ